jgi:hypothetical protein
MTHLASAVAMILGTALTVSSAAEKGSAQKGENSEWCRYPGLGCPERIVTLGPGNIVYTKPTIVSAYELHIADGTQIETNGNSLVISVEKSLVVEGNAVITALNAATLPPALPGKPPRSADGISYDPGPGSGGRDRAVRGYDGGEGAAGTDGDRGGPGQNAGPISVTVGDRATGRLSIINIGGPGGAGGDGGDGGEGGTAQQGGRGKPAWNGCNAGGGFGGNGGKGGRPGKAGLPGPGGKGGDTTFNVKVDSGSSFSLTIDVRGGYSGPVGKDGNPGNGGGFGYGGRGSGFCRGEETNRKGQPGPRGDAATSEAVPPVRSASGTVSVSGVAANIVSNDP